MNKARSILFDLDGTLLDTAPDIIMALNAVLVAHGKPAVSLSTARPFVSRGAPGLIGCGFGITEHAEQFPHYVEEFLGHYREGLCQQTCLFEGMAELLDKLDEAKCIWGVVTNKRSSLSEPLLKQMNLLERMHVLVSGDTTPEQKPSPMPLLHACGMAGILPEQTIYVGDDPRDILSAKAAGMMSVAVQYGYFDANDNLEDWGANWVIDHPRELTDLLALS